MIRSISILILFTLVCQINSAKSFGRGKSDGHEADAYSVFPFKKSKAISDWFEEVHKTIDYPYNSYFKGLRETPHQNFSWGTYGHRLLFHWGFNGRPWTPQIAERVSICKWDSKTVLQFQQKLINEQARRNKIVMIKTSETLHLGMSGQLREYTNGFASILYDTHILGDYTTTKIEPLIGLDMVIDDIKVALYKKLKGGEDALRINKKLDNTKKTHPNQRARASAVLSILQKEVPNLILSTQNGYFKKHFEGNGIKLKGNIAE